MCSVIKLEFFIKFLKINKIGNNLNHAGNWLIGCMGV